MSLPAKTHWLASQIERMRALLTCAHEGKSYLPAIKQDTLLHLEGAGLILSIRRGEYAGEYKLTSKGWELVLRALSEAP